MTLTVTLDLDDQLVNGTCGVVVGYGCSEKGIRNRIHLLPNDPMVGRKSRVNNGVLIML